METQTYVILIGIGALLGAALTAFLCVLFLYKPIKVPYSELTSYDKQKITHIVSYTEKEPDKYIVVTSNGSYRVPENFMLYHSGELIYIENIETGKREYAYPVECYGNEIRDLNPPPPCETKPTKNNNQ